jgi:hypothetical protein
LTQAGLAGIVMAALLAVSHSSSPSESVARTREGPEPRSFSPGEKAAAERRIEALYAGIPQHGEVLGRPGAPVTLQLFADLECREAHQFALGALPFLVRHWVRDGKLRIVYRGYPEETVWPDIFNHQQAAALAAGRQGKLWQYVDLFYHRQGPEFVRYAITPFLEAMARGVRGLDLERWRAERHEKALVRRVRADVRLGAEYGLRPHHWLTPAFFVGPTGGPAKPLLHFSLTESGEFDEAIEGVLDRRG